MCTTVNYSEHLYTILFQLFSFAYCILKSRGGSILVKINKQIKIKTPRTSHNEHAVELLNHSTTKESVCSQKTWFCATHYGTPISDCIMGQLLNERKLGMVIKLPHCHCWAHEQHP